MTFDKIKLKEDLRKLGVGIILTGLVGFVLPGNTVGFWDGLVLIIVGLKFWGIGLLKDTNSDEG